MMSVEEKASTPISKRKEWSRGSAESFDNEREQKYG